MKGAWQNWTGSYISCAYYSLQTVCCHRVKTREQVPAGQICGYTLLLNIMNHIHLICSQIWTAPDVIAQSSSTFAAQAAIGSALLSLLSTRMAIFGGTPPRPFSFASHSFIWFSLAFIFTLIFWSSHPSHTRASYALVPIVSFSSSFTFQSFFDFLLILFLSTTEFAMLLPSFLPPILLTMITDTNIS
jgi:hypothetical protein